MNDNGASDASVDPSSPSTARKTVAFDSSLSTLVSGSMDGIEHNKRAGVSQSPTHHHRHHIFAVLYLLYNPHFSCRRKQQQLLHR